MWHGMYIHTSMYVRLYCFIYLSIEHVKRCTKLLPNYFISKFVFKGKVVNSFMLINFFLQRPVFKQNVKNTL